MKFWVSRDQGFMDQTWIRPSSNMFLSACHVIATWFGTTVVGLIFQFFEVYIPMLYFHTIKTFSISF